ncbi:hypothetical protein KXV56_004127 [Aspergillus fumigatus]|nr:hypothetical protein CNMCM8714_006822 [Aspergillus fumigatus]KAH2080227.1 hypothetical protein KXW32_006875 [Aspergillus fumigatus]KAH3605830.1 hypothetical protein KXV56_004127 [Aspergillus fumigatus]
MSRGWGTVSTSFAELGKCAARLARLGSSAKDFLDKASIALSSNGDRAAYFIKAASIAGALHTGGACIAAYQVVKGVNELCDSRAFATLVYNMVRNKVGNPTTWVLVYHPDTMWTHHFEDEIRGRGSLGTEFMGIFHDLDTAVVFMMGIRRAQKEDPELCDVVPHFELLMPAYYPIVITTPLCFPDEIQPFTLYCDKYNGESLVWMNLPGVAEGAHGNLGLYKRPKRYWDLGYWFGANESPPRTLGFRGDEEGNASNEYLSETEKAESEESEAENVEQPDDTATVSAQGFDEFESYVSLDAEDIHAKSGINGVHEEDLGNNLSSSPTQIKPTEPILTYGELRVYSDNVEFDD